MTDQRNTFSGYEQIIKQTSWGEVGFLDILKFLYRYGYFTGIMDMTFGELVKKIRSGMPELREAITRFQDFYGLTVDGDPGPQTQKAMTIPRCGCPDIMPKVDSEYAEVKNYQGKGRWPIEKMENVLYHIDVDDLSLDDSLSEKACVDAANRWNEVCGIKLKRTGNRSEANIYLTAKRIDSSGGTLALGWFPMSSSPNQSVEQRLDTMERWNYDYLAEVSCHEFGHNLGWGHKNGESIMHPYATGKWPKPTRYDISVATDYYGKPSTPEPDPPPEEPGSPESNPFARIELRIPHPETGVLTECYVAPKTQFGGL